MFQFHAAARPPRPTGVLANRALPHGRAAALPPHLWGRAPALPRPLPPPPPPLAAAGGGVVRARGEADLARARLHGAAREEEAGGEAENAAAASGGLLGDSAEGVAIAGPVVAPEERGAGGGELDRKRGLALAPHPPPKRRAVSAQRRFPPGCGRDAPPPLIVCSNGEDGSRVGAAPISRRDSTTTTTTTTPEQASAPRRPAGTGEEGGLRPEAAPANAGFGGVPVADGAAAVSDGYHPGPEAATATATDGGDGVARLVVKDGGTTPGDGELVMKESTPTTITRLPPKRRMVSATRRFPPACGRDAMVPIASRGGIEEVGLQLEALPADAGLGALEEVAATNGRRSDVCAMDATEAVSKDALDGIAEVQEEQEDGEIPTETNPLLQESQVTLNNVLQELKSARHECAVPPIVAAEPSLRRISNDKMDGNMVQRKVKSVSWAVPEDVKVMNKCEGISPKVATKPSAQGPPKEYLRAEKVSESCSMKRESLHVAAGVQGQGIMKSKVTFTARKSVQSPAEANHKRTLVNLDRPYSTGKETESVATMRESLVPRTKLKIIFPAQNKQLPANIASTPALHSKAKLKDKEASPLDDDEIWKATAGTEGKLKMYMNNPSCVPSVGRHMQHGGQTADARSKVKMICRKFQFICRTLVQDVEQRSVKSSRIDLAADKLIRTLPGFTKHGPIVGKVPGVEIGDEFLYRVELAIVGLHRPYQGGIDTMKDINDTLIAISIVASGGYPDELSSSGEIIYTGSGGKPAGKKENEDQKLVRGNLALKNCINTKTPVRVIHGFKGPNREEGSHSKAKEVSTFTYDGLYNVVECWQEGLPGSRVFKYRLQRITGQPELPLHVAKGLRKSVVRPGLCIADISQGKEKIPICVINNIDNARPASFKYITRNRGSSLTAKRSQGCDCTDGCSDSANCTCIVKNGGEIPFNFNGAVVHAKPLIFECGPSCKCPPSCHNRVSQLGMNIPLEVFRTTNTGWGVRSLRSISSGSFICEYVGELLQDQEANQRSNDDYLFDIGQNYHIWKEMSSAIPGLNSSGVRSLIMEDEGFTIDAAEYGNIGRFINHSCSPNLYAQSVLWDHDDKRVPHIMFFAADNISPLQELTYDYNYEIGHVHDVNGGVKVKYCHCGSAQCRGRLY